MRGTRAGEVRPTGAFAAVRHQFDQPYVIDASATTATFGLTATPWDDVVRATAGAVPVTA